MKASIKVKGAIQVDKDGLDNIRAGSCAHMGVKCQSDIVMADLPDNSISEMVDRLYI